MTGAGVFIIAEAGVNHNGNPDLALKLVDEAAAAGADAVKFQTFKADKLASVQAPKAEYQKRAEGGAESQLDMLRRLELSDDMHARLIERCTQRGILFMSSPFDLDSLAFLAGPLGISRIKLGSGELTNAPLLLAAARTGLPVILSTGMSNLAEVEQALGVLAYGMEPGETASNPGPSVDAFEQAYADMRAQALLRERVSLLHCTTEYPAPFDEVNLKAMDTLRAAFGLAVGYSDHTPGIAMAVAAVARGACIIEKHFTLDRNLPGPDHQASLEPAALAQMVASIRQVEVALGDGVKLSRPSERRNMVVARKSVVAVHAIAAGRVIGAEDVAVMRPGNGRSPMRLWETIGSIANRDYAQGEPLDP